MSVIGSWARCLSDLVTKDLDHIVCNKILTRITVTKDVNTFTSAVRITTSSSWPSSALVTGLG